MAKSLKQKAVSGMIWTALQKYSTMIISFISGIILARLLTPFDYGVWSLVAQHILTALIPALVFWFYIKWRPQLTFSWNSFKELFSFGFYMFLTHLINSFSIQITRIVHWKTLQSCDDGILFKGIRNMAADGVTEFYEVGTDDTLQKMVRRMKPDLLETSLLHTPEYEGKVHDFSIVKE